MTPGSRASRQLAEIRQELLDARERLDRLAARVDPEVWSRRPEPDRWSAGECVAHLNLTSEAYLPEIRSLIGKGQAMVGRPPRSYRCDPAGWLIYQAVRPNARIRTKTPDAFIPRIETSQEVDVADFRHLQETVIECVDAARGLPLNRLKLRSPFNALFKYNLYSTLRLIAAHQHRHLGQAERAVDRLG